MLLHGAAKPMTTSSIIAKSAHVIDTVCASRTRLNLTQIVELTGIAKSSAHRVLSILIQENLVAFDPTKQVYEPGPRLIRWAASTLSANDLPELSAAAMEALSQRVGAHVALAILDGTSVLWLKSIEFGMPFRLAPRVGERSPVHVCAAGKALLAFARPSKRDALLNQLTFERHTDRTITSRGAMEAELVRVKEANIAACDREEFLQIAGIAAPIFGLGGEVVAALSMWDSLDRRKLPALLVHRNDLLDTARSISERLGHSIGRSRRTA